MKISRRLLAISLVVCASLLTAAERAPEVAGLKLRASGAFAFDGLDYALVHFGPEWAAAGQGEARVEVGYPQAGNPDWETRGTVAVQGVDGRLAYRQRITRLDEHAFAADYHVTHVEGAPTRELALQVMLPMERVAGRAIIIDGVAKELPAQMKAGVVFIDPAPKEHTVSLPGTTGTIEIKGVFGVLVQDQRQWKQDAFTVRLQFPLPDKPLKDAALKVSVRRTVYRSVPVSLRGQANRGFRDEVAGDHAGGWTDQGPANDLATFAPGVQTVAGVTFDIADPEKNHGRAAVVLGRPETGHPLEPVVVPLPERPVWKNLYLLHAAAWLPATGTPVGRLRIRYADGTESVRDVLAGQDAGDWWRPSSLPNAVVGWRGENASSSVGLYVSRFPLEGKPVAAVALEGVAEALWMVAGMAGSPDDFVPFRPQIPLVLKAGPEWAPYTHSVEIEPGGVFDFSSLTDAPAGKYGPLTATPAGHFAFAERSGERVRLWGVNLCFTANYLEHAEADRLAARLAASGYNAVRFHHYDQALIGKRGTPPEPDAAQLDRLDYLFAAMKRHGLYVNIDLFTFRELAKEEMAALGIDPKEDTRAQFKALIPLVPEAFTAWSRFAQQLLTHKNPYTGFTWAEDPALSGICPVNEDTLTVWVNCTPEVRRRYDEAFEVWWKDAAHRARAGDKRAAGFNRFLGERQVESDARLHAFLRSLGVKAPLTGANFVSTQGLAFLRERYGYVDNHEYWDHPGFPEKKWSLPMSFVQGSAARATAQVPRAMMAARVWGKPYVVTEFNFVRPNQYRAEGGVLMPAYASLQDWDGLYNFEYASSREAAVAGGVTGMFAIAEDPVGLLADRVGALLFRRGDIAPGRRAIGYAVRSTEAFETPWTQFPREFSQIGLIARIGSGTGTPAEELARQGLDAVVMDGPADAKQKNVYTADATLLRRLQDDRLLPRYTGEDGTTFASDTGEIALKGKDGAMSVVTPRSELYLLPPGQVLGGKQVKVKNGAAFGTVAVVSLDGKPLAYCGRILITHLTDALATGMEFADEDRRLLVKRGGLPHLVRAGSVKIEMKLDATKSWQAWVVDATGKRQREVKLIRKADTWMLLAQTVTPEGTQLAYEIAGK